MLSKQLTSKYQRRKNLTLSLFIISVAVVLALCLFTVMQLRTFSDVIYQETENRLLTVSRYASELVTAKELNELQTPEDLNKPIFGVLRERMVRFAEDNSVLFVYYMRNTGDNLAQYILDNDLTDETVDLTTEPFEWEDKAIVAMQSRAAAAEMHEYLTGYENLISAFAPVFDENGEVAAIVGIDIRDEHLLEIDRTMNIFVPLLAFGVLCIFVCGLLNVFIHNRADKDRIKLSAEVEKGDSDPLTGIYNRRFFDRHINRLIDSLSRSGGMLGLLMIDIDFFKRYNDNYGHLEGDNCLQLIAESLREGIRREDDFIARYGGEEFIAILPDTDLGGARAVAERLLDNVRKLNLPHETSSVAKRVTVSIGVVSGKVIYGMNWKDFVKRADEALYTSKQNGRDQLSCLDVSYADMHSGSASGSPTDTAEIYNRR